MKKEKTTMGYVNGADLDIPVVIRKKDGADVHEASGSWTGGVYMLNSSSILTRLIQEAGRWCEHYASDLFIWWKAVETSLLVREEDAARTFIFGMCQDGVDGAGTYVRKTGGDYAFSHPEYRAVWGVDVIKNGDSVKMTLYKVERAEGRVEEQT